MATARFMETWAHSLDIGEALGHVARPTDRIRHVAHLGVRTRNFAFGVHGLQPPAEEFRIELTAPSGEVWEWGPAEAAQSVRGSAYDFCLRVTQRRHRADLDLVAVGPDADRWLDLAQAFAGPPGPGREASHGGDLGLCGRELQRLLRRPALRHARDARGRAGGRRHRRLPRRADHADPGARPDEGPRTRVRQDLRPAGRGLSRPGPGAGSPDRQQRRRAQPVRAGREAPGGGGRAGPLPGDRVGRRGRPGRPRRRARLRRGADRERLPRCLRHRPRPRGGRGHRGDRPGHRRLGGGGAGDLAPRLVTGAVRRAGRRRRGRSRDRVRHAGHRWQLLRVPRPAARRPAARLPDRGDRRRRQLGDHQARRHRRTGLGRHRDRAADVRGAVAPLPRTRRHRGAADDPALAGGSGPGPRLRRPRGGATGRGSRSASTSSVAGATRWSSSSPASTSRRRRRGCGPSSTAGSPRRR